MGLIKVLVETLLILKACQSLTIHQPKNNKDNPKFNSVNSAAMSKMMPYLMAASLNFPQLGYSNINAIPTQYNHQWPAINSKTSWSEFKQPAIGAGLEKEIWHETKKVTGKRRQPSYANYHNEIYHLNTTVKKASPWANTKQDTQPKIVRKQRNLKENKNDKLIEQHNVSIKSINKDNDQPQLTLAAASEQPSTMAIEPATKTSHEIRSLHDIFLNYPKSHHVNFGHVELSPVLFEKRFQTQKGGNRYKGEVMWLDKTGGFAQHSWDLAQGRL